MTSRFSFAISAALLAATAATAATITPQQPALSDGPMKNVQFFLTR